MQYTNHSDRHRDLVAAGVTQRRMFPESPLSSNGFEVQYQICSSTELTGDFVGVVELGQDESAFLVADVAGHGPAAALVTVALKSFMARLRGSEIRGPALVLQALNAELLDLDFQKHVCAVFGQWRADGSLDLGCAGAYPRPLLRQLSTLRSDASTGSDTSFIDQSGKALGLFAEPGCEARNYQLASGDRLIVMTDGVFDLQEGTELESKEARLAAAVQEGTEASWLEKHNSALNDGACDDVTWFRLERLR